MRLHLRSVLTAFAMTVTTVFAAEAATYKANVVSVIDGDTLNIMHDGSKQRVILYGVDCPELTQSFGQQAKQFTDGACFRKDVTIEEHGQDSRGRTIAVITLADGSNLNQQLVTQGLAWWSDKYAPQDTVLKQLFETAKRDKRGLWAESGAIAPWTFRNGAKSTEAVIKTK